ncbi:MAG: hypothetical protein JWO67_1498 [Streptosporangiaceae bacterium]|nr:hypothetical protein [Streptosporangiaceae bacterium]
MPPKKSVQTRMTEEAIDEVSRIAKFKGVSTAQVMRWAVDAYVDQHSVELSNLYRPASGGTLEFSNTHQEIQDDAALAEAWGEKYDIRKGH